MLASTLLPHHKTKKTTFKKAPENNGTRRLDREKHWRLKTKQPFAIVRLISDAITKGMFHHAKACLIDSEPDKTVLHYGTNDLST